MVTEKFELASVGNLHYASFESLSKLLSNLFGRIPDKFGFERYLEYSEMVRKAHDLDFLFGAWAKGIEEIIGFGECTISQSIFEAEYIKIQLNWQEDQRKFCSNIRWHESNLRHHVDRVLQNTKFKYDDLAFLL